MGSGRRCPSAVRGADTAAIGQAQTPPRSPAPGPTYSPLERAPLRPAPSFRTTPIGLVHSPAPGSHHPVLVPAISPKALLPLRG